MLSSFVYLECHPRRTVPPSPRDLRGRRLPRPCRGVSGLDCSFSYVFPNLQLSTFNFQPPVFPKSFTCNTYGPSASVANKRLTACLSYLDATGSKITALVLGWVENSVFLSDSRGFGVAGSFSPCAFALTAW